MVGRKDINNQTASPPPSTSTPANDDADPESHHRMSNTSIQLDPTTTQTSAQSLHEAATTTTHAPENIRADVSQPSIESPLPATSTATPPPSLEALPTILESPERNRPLRQARSLAVRHQPTHRSRSTHSTPSNSRRPSPYAIPPGFRRSQSFPRSIPETATTTVEMSSSNSSGNTSTSGNNPTYQLPYAPFPYPMPPQGGNQGSGSGK